MDGDNKKYTGVDDIQIGWRKNSPNNIKRRRKLDTFRDFVSCGLFVVKVISFVHITISTLIRCRCVERVVECRVCVCVCVPGSMPFCFPSDFASAVASSSTLCYGWNTYACHSRIFIHLYSIRLYGYYTLNLCKQHQLRRLDTWIFAMKGSWWMEYS